MRTFDFAPLYRSTVGFDRLFDMLDASTSRPDWPPYDIEKEGENRYRITHGSGGVRPERDRADPAWHQPARHRAEEGREERARQMLHHGIAAVTFKQTFNLADHVKVVSADLENGLLSIDLVREVPEQLKPRRIEIGTPATGALGQDNQPAQIDQKAERQAA